MPSLHKKNRALKQILRNRFRGTERKPVRREAAPANVPAYTLSTDIPKAYNDTYIRAIPQDPQTTFVYWEITSRAGKAYMGNDDAAKIQETLPARVSNNNAHDGNHRWQNHHNHNSNHNNNHNQWQNHNQWNDHHRFDNHHCRHDNSPRHDNNNRWHDDNRHHSHNAHAHTDHTGHNAHSAHSSHSDNCVPPAAPPFEITLDIQVRQNARREQQLGSKTPEASLSSAILYKTEIEKTP